MSHYYCGLEVDSREIQRLEAELAEMRRTHVRLVGIDVEALREAVAMDVTELTDWRHVDTMHDLARQVLAALDGEQQVHASYCMEGPNHPGECRP